MVVINKTFHTLILPVCMKSSSTLHCNSEHYWGTRSLGALRASTFSLRPFGHLWLCPSRPFGRSGRVTQNLTHMLTCVCVRWGKKADGPTNGQGFSRSRIALPRLSVDRMLINTKSQIQRSSSWATNYYLVIPSVLFSFFSVFSSKQFWVTSSSLDCVLAHCSGATVATPNKQDLPP